MSKRWVNSCSAQTNLDWMCSRDFSAVLSQASVTFSISDLSRTSRSLFMGLNRPERDNESEQSVKWITSGIGFQT